MELSTLIISLIILTETTILLTNRHRSVRNITRRKIYVDTSVLMDGRILNIAKTGFINDNLIITKSTLRELQLLADGKDSLKRSRARAGLDLVNELERIIHFDVEIFDDGDDYLKVDEQLLKLAKASHGAILTLDFNLIKVAAAENIETLNINDLALAVRNEFLPGEKIKLKIIEKGANKGQGIAHLPDGTMVVVDNAANKIGTEITAEFVNFRETSAGKMIFARIATTAKPQPSYQLKRQTQSTYPKHSDRTHQ